MLHFLLFGSFVLLVLVTHYMFFWSYPLIKQLSKALLLGIYGRTTVENLVFGSKKTEKCCNRLEYNLIRLLLYVKETDVAHKTNSNIWYIFLIF